MRRQITCPVQEPIYGIKYLGLAREHASRDFLDQFALKRIALDRRPHGVSHQAGANFRPIDEQCRQQLEKLVVQDVPAPDDFACVTRVAFHGILQHRIDAPCRRDSESLRHGPGPQSQRRRQATRSRSRVPLQPPRRQSGEDAAQAARTIGAESAGQEIQGLKSRQRPSYGANAHGGELWPRFSTLGSAIMQSSEAGTWCSSVARRRRSRSTILSISSAIRLVPQHLIQRIAAETQFTALSHYRKPSQRTCYLEL